MRQVDFKQISQAVPDNVAIDTKGNNIQTR